MNTAALIAALVELLATAVRKVIEAGDDRAKQQEAVMQTEEQLYRLRMQQKFGV